MAKVEIDAAMVERGLRAVKGKGAWDTKCAMQAILDAALNPPPEPEIKVTEAMENAGLDAYFGTSAPGRDWSGTQRVAMANAFRAMFAVRPIVAASEIKVTEAMRKAGAYWFREAQHGSFEYFADLVYRAMRPLEPAFISTGWNCCKCGADNIFDIKRHTCAPPIDASDWQFPAVFRAAPQETEVGVVAVGFPSGRTGGLVSIHVGSSYALLNKDERLQLAAKLTECNATVQRPPAGSS